jgi:hypothetical protein
VSRILILAALALSSSCSIWLPDNLEYNRLPGYPQSNFLQKTKKGVYCPAELSLALHTFSVLWDGYSTNSLVPEKIGYIDLVVQDGLLEHPKGPASGVTYVTEDRVKIEFSTITAPDGPVRELHDTALFHELVHLALWWDFGDPDANHSSSGGPWTDAHHDFVEYAESVFQNLNYAKMCDL